MVAKSCLRTARHSPENYNTYRKYFGLLLRWSLMISLAKGGAKGEPG